MERIAGRWRWLWQRIRSRSVEMRLGIRVSIAAVASFLLAHWLSLPLSLWAVLTAVILTQMSVGRSLNATLNYMIGTLGGAIYSGAVAVLIPHATELGLLVVLAIGIAPMAMLAAIDPRFSTAPFTAVLVLLAPTLAHLTPLQSATYRVIEVALGAVIGLAVSLLILPARAQVLAVEAAARMLDLMAQVLPELFKGFAQNLEQSEVRRIHDSLGRAIVKLDVMTSEAERERLTSLAATPDYGPLLRTLLRLRHDLVMIGRAAAEPLPEAVQARLAPALMGLCAAAGEYLRESSKALLSRRQPPPLGPFEAELAAYLDEIGDIRRLRLTRDLPVEAVERIFALGFALEQLHQNFCDLARVVRERAPSPKTTGSGAAADAASAV